VAAGGRKAQRCFDVYEKGRIGCPRVVAVVGMNPSMMTASGTRKMAVALRIGWNHVWASVTEESL
jgi:hypothetical protein